MKNLKHCYDEEQKEEPDDDGLGVCYLLCVDDFSPKHSGKYDVNWPPAAC